ncbi:hypothetical protein CHS0354_030072 [Potamilus streckersoni]|uniref:FAD/NAD(P)-binding domain-containing protein n=1 Tax=Potamilus streckersoni TaxID=2493646 RepID=A0AAE0RMA3_9BIVA|nr:hypothetical protein CHS0354_030072 [Potamilus streckersoni]
MSYSHHKLIILGSGPAGCTAAIYAARSGLHPLMLQGNQPGGQLTITTEVENYPGFSKPVLGGTLMMEMMSQALHYGTAVDYHHIVSADLSRRPFTLTSEDGTGYTCDSLIIAAGASAKMTGLPGEKEYMGMGVSACATCDGFFFKNTPVCVLGGGNTAVEEALYPFQYMFKVTAVRLKRNTGEQQMLEINAVFIAIGHQPNTSLFKGQLDMDSTGYIQTVKGSTLTSVPGVFAAGDVQDSVYRQAVTAAGSGCMSAIDCERFLSQQDL